MAATRRNILLNADARTKYRQGVLLLKQEPSGRTTADFGIGGPGTSVSTYDLFVIWHYLTMMTLTPPGNAAGRNAAHRGPIFLPWHRVLLMLLESNLQRVLNDSTFGLPYWDWASDGKKTASKQKTSKVWAATCMAARDAGQDRAVQVQRVGCERLPRPYRSQCVRSADRDGPRPRTILRHVRRDHPADTSGCAGGARPDAE